MAYRKTTKNPDAPDERAIWRGSISFGLVQIPVGLYRADAEQELHFTMLDKKDHAKVRFERKNSVTGKALTWPQIVKGFEVERGEYVVLTDDDFAQANVKSTGGIDIVDFVDEGEIDPIYFVKPYYLLPMEQNTKTYVLLREVLRQTGRVGIAKIVLRTRQHLALVRIRGDALMLELLRFEHELRPTTELKFPKSGKKGADLSEREVKMATSLVQSMTASFRPQDYRDDYHEDLLALIERKRRKGTKAAPAAGKKSAPAKGNVVDIVGLLQQSVSARKGGAGGAGKKEAPARAARAKAKRAIPRTRARTPSKGGARRSGAR